ncbi:MAG: RecBCD enzyme subunit RecB [Syntrophaceae bacterium PtaB.Bin038]|nr:MAG: RecBCD enzyme subunit RecB [Syntrophaceae bacterium PtaB.Bin038]
MPEATPRFDLLKSPLDGRNLIEASAGTGKTYAIAGLFLRLLVEKRLAPSDILVVTYTVAATEELRDRIRRMIREALDVLAGKATDKPFLADFARGLADRKDARDRLREALRGFDEAPIFTIHSFCRRMLSENAFESGSPFDTELLPDERMLREEIVRDFWRKHFYEAPSEFVLYAREQFRGPASFLSLLRAAPFRHDARILPEAPPERLEGLAALRKAFAGLRRSWPKSREGVERALRDEALNRTKYGRTERYLEAMDAFLARPWAALPLSEDLLKFGPDALAAAVRKNRRAPTHRFFERFGDFISVANAVSGEMEGQVRFLRCELFRYVRQELARRKRHRNLRSYDDLLSDLRAALRSEGSGILSGAIRKKYRAALVDEFQDTDPVQFAIFESVFGQGETALFLIGDPKQAIYSFRGADLFAYIRAASYVQRRYTLAENWRSEPGLVRAVNTLFGRPRHAFLYEAVPFEEARSADREVPSLTIGGRADAPLKLWALDGGGETVSIERARERIRRAVAAEVARLIEAGRRGEARIGRRPLREADMAVLVRTNREALLVQEALTGLGVHSVLYTTGNLFDTEEALETERVLKAVAEPGDEAAVRTALATDLMGLDGASIERLMGDPTAWEERLRRFHDWRDTWERHGFVRMFRDLLRAEGVRPRLLALPGGERRLTNVLHLAEVLHGEETRRRAGMGGLIQWLATQRDEETPRLEEHQLRLESDADAVKVVTIHKSKGLEYPVVFCPFNWGSSRAGDVYNFHDEKDGWQLNVALEDAGEEARRAAEREQLAENVRLLYVSVTRAKNRCYLVWGPINRAETSSLAWVLHGPDGDPSSAVDATAARVAGMGGESLRREMEAVAAASGGSVEVVPMPEEAVPAIRPDPDRTGALEAREFRRKVERAFAISSFSSLVEDADRGAAGEGLPESPDRDERVRRRAAEESPGRADIFSFPRGPRAGKCLHAVFERIDFADAARGALEGIVREALAEYGFEPLWCDTLCDMIGRVIEAPLDPARGVRLSGLDRRRCLHELGFTFPLQALEPAGLRELFAGAAGDIPERIGSLRFRPVEGFMKGFIDLVFEHGGRFYLVDWKSNHLGARAEDYGAEALAAVMGEDLYVLQYHLYAVALHEYLKGRVRGYDYDRHFGGVFYVFLRGVDPALGPGFGIFRDRPDRRLVETLAEGLVARPCGREGP